MTPHISPPRSTINVWVLEDHDRYRNDLVRLLGQVSDLRCAGAFSTCEAMLDVFERDQPTDVADVALIDIELNGGIVDGIECMSLLKDRLPHVASVMLTIHDTAERIFAALRAGASGYLVKPASVDEVVEAIREAHRGGMPMSPPVARKVRQFFTGADADYDLSPREIEVLTWMEKGFKQKDIAAALFLSHHTSIPTYAISTRSCTCIPASRPSPKPSGSGLSDLMNFEVHLR